MPAGYQALERIALPTGIVEAGAKFGSDAVPGRAWLPLDDEARAAVKARDEAVKVEPAPKGEDPRIAELQAKLADAETQIAALTSRLADAEKAPPPVDQAKRDEDIEAALGLLDPEADFVKTGERAGRPKCAAVEKIVGYPVFVAEIDAAWDKRPA